MSLFAHIFILIQMSWSQIIQVPDNFEFTPPRWSGMYLQPNEHLPDRMKPALQLAPEGVYLTVGTERAFFGAALAKNATHLLVIDLDPQVIRYNETNRALLIAATDIDEFAIFKFASRYSDWQIARDRLLERGYYKEAFHLGERHFETYTSATLLKSPRIVADVYRKVFFPNSTNSHAMDSNYVLNADAFQRLKVMAEERRMQFVVGNYGNLDFIRIIFRSLREKGLDISTFDISNMYDSYLSRRILGELLSLAAQHSHKESVLIGSLHMPFRSYFASNTWSQNTLDLRNGIHLANYLLQLAILDSELRFLGGNPRDLQERNEKLKSLESEIGIEPFQLNLENINILKFSGSCQIFFQT